MGESTHSASDGPVPELGDTVGRYTLRVQLGAGGMGTVYAADDPELDRRVAVKLLHPHNRGPRHTARLIREGQALARITHPNVVQVFEVGRHNDDVFIVMELVHGQALSTWLAQERPWPDVVRVFIDAARGLEAAHAKGLIHRDFKPANAIIDAKGRVKVLDFGLARGLSGSSRASDDQAGSHTSGQPFATRLTRAGTVMGTPAYMAAEQFTNAAVDHRTDQHAFCVSLCEALYQRRPFGEGEYKALRQAVVDEAIIARPDTAVPRALWSIVVRGTRARPDRRFANMNAIVVALERAGSAQRRRRVRLLATGAVAAGGVAVWLNPVAATSSRCESSDTAVAAAWNETMRDAVVRRLEMSGTAYANDTRTRVVARLDGYAQQWTEQHRTVCRALAQGEAEVAPRLDRRMQCLHRTARDLKALVVVLADADAIAVEHATAAAASLPRLSQCLDDGGLSTDAALLDDQELRAEVEAIAQGLADVRAAHHAGRSADARAVSTALVNRAKQTQHPPLIAEVLASDGEIAMALSDHELAAERLEGAYWAAETSHDDWGAAEHAIRLSFVLSDRLGQVEQGRSWSRHAQGAIRRSETAGVDVRSLRASLASARAAALSVQGNLYEALEQLRRAKAELAALPDDDFALELAKVELTMGSVLTGLGRYQDARNAFIAVLPRYQRAFGEHHPRLAPLYGGLANLNRMLGDGPAAAQHAQTGIDIIEDAYGPGHATAAKLYLNKGGGLEISGDYEAAAVAYGRANSIAAHNTVAAGVRAFALAALAGIDRLRGDLDAARRGFEEAARIFERSGQSAQLGTTLSNLAGVYGSLGRFEDAIDAIERSVRLVAAARGATHPAVAEAEAERGRVLLDAERPDDAVAALRRAEHIATATHPDDNELVVYIRRELARAEHMAGNLDVALALAKRVLDDGVVGGSLVASAELNLARIHVERAEQPEAVAAAMRGIAAIAGDSDPALASMRAALKDIAEDSAR